MIHGGRGDAPHPAAPARLLGGSRLDSNDKRRTHLSLRRAADFETLVDYVDLKPAG